MDFVQTGWALLPPVIAILIALKTKEVYLSLFFGIVSGALLLSNFHIIDTVNVMFDTMIGSLSDTWNIGILIFLIFFRNYSYMTDLKRVEVEHMDFGGKRKNKIKTRLTIFNLLVRILIL